MDIIESRMQQWYAGSLGIKELLLLAKDQETPPYIVMCGGIVFIVLQMKTLYLIVTSAVVHFLNVIPAVMYPNIHVKVSLVMINTIIIHINKVIVFTTIYR